MSTKGYDNDNFNEINMPSHPPSKMPEVHLGSGREQWQETKSSFLLTWAMLKLQQLLEFQSGRRGGTSDALSFWDRSGHVSLLFLNASFQGNNPCQDSHGTTHLCSCSCITLQMEEKFSFKSKMQRGLLLESKCSRLRYVSILESISKFSEVMRLLTGRPFI